ncbi:hypothetical protein [Streptomyces sp. NPDC051364]|uniref:hypothetical protein n=1 Tax=Streptomyces sp. NPDC051364 TaxID=3155799 RepID=UPI00341B1FB0
MTICDDPITVCTGRAGGRAGGVIIAVCGLETIPHQTGVVIMAVIEIQTTEEFEQLIDEHKPVVAFFTAEWVRPEVPPLCGSG